MASVDKEPFFSCRETFKMLCQHGRVVYVSPAGKVPIDSGLFPPPHRYFLPWEFFFFFFQVGFFFFFHPKAAEKRWRCWDLGFGFADLGGSGGVWAPSPHSQPSPCPH